MGFMKSTTLSPLILVCTNSCAISECSEDQGKSEINGGEGRKMMIARLRFVNYVNRDVLRPRPLLKETPHPGECKRVRRGRTCFGQRLLMLITFY